MKEEKYDSLSNDKLVGFEEIPHKYTYIPDPNVKFKSGSSIAKLYEPEQDWDLIAKNYIKKHKLDKTVEEVRSEWNEIATNAANIGTELHLVGEMYWQGIKIPNKTNDPRYDAVIQFVDDMRANGYEMEQVEKLVYTTKPYALCGLIDMLLYKINDKGKKEYYIYDYKFCKGIQKKSFYSRKDGFKMMKGPFSNLYDCNLSHYSIQQAMYEYLNDLPVKGKFLVEFKTKPSKKDKNYNIIKCLNIKFYDKDGKLYVKSKRTVSEIKL